MSDADLDAAAQTERIAEAEAADADAAGASGAAAADAPGRQAGEGSGGKQQDGTGLVRAPLCSSEQRLQEWTSMQSTAQYSSARVVLLVVLRLDKSSIVLSNAHLQAHSDLCLLQGLDAGWLSSAADCHASLSFPTAFLLPSKGLSENKHRTLGEGFH